MKIENLLKNKRVWIYLAIAIIAAFFIILTLKKVISGTTETARDGYKSIADVPGVTFLMKKDFSDFATAVMEISPSMDFVDYQTYSYKNGKDTYLIFNIKSYVVIVKKGSSFAFAENGVEDSLKKNSLSGIWFEPNGKDFVLKSFGSRYEIAVTAQVVITNAIYNDFEGVLTTVTKDGEEWAMFAGSTKATSEEYTDIINYIGYTMKLTDEDYTEKVEFAINSDGTFEQIQETPVITVTEVTDNHDSEGNTSAEYIGSANTSEPSDDNTEATESQIEQPVESTDQPEHSVEAAPSSSVNNHTTEELHRPLMLNQNQKQYDRDQDKVYTSDIYSMMDIGTTGYMDLYWDNGNGVDNAFIHVTKLYDSEETKQLIERYCASGEGYYDAFEAPQGTHFEAVEYNVNFLGKEPTYVNIVMCGLDGETLRYRGISYTGRTYDILSNVRIKDDWQTGYISFYAVPNGCKEYALKCGSVVNESTGYLAYYKIGR